MELTQAQVDTNNIAIDVYKRLRTEVPSKVDFQEIEECLSTHIYDSEKMIQLMRSQGNSEFEEEYYRRRTLLKRIADGLAWQILDYDTHAIHGLSIGHTAGFMYGKESYPNERNIVGAAYQISSIRAAIQCDITNFLHLSDVVVVKNDGQILFIEEKGKSSKNNRRANRQKNRYKEISSFLIDGHKEPINVNGTLLRTIKSAIVYDHYWKELDDLASAALIDGFSWKLLDDCIFLSVNDTRSRGSVEDYQKALAGVKWDDPFFIISSLGRHLQKNLTQIPVTCLPITLFPIQHNHGIEFLLGNLDAIIVVNIRGIIAKLSDVGIMASFQKDKKVRVDLENFHLTIEDGAWSKVLNELVTVSSFINFLIESKKMIGEGFITEVRVDPK